MMMVGQWLSAMLVVVMIGQTISQSPIEAAVKNLLGLIQQPLPSRGKPFPKISGPKTKDRVCIIGAGPAGIHMAQSLKKRNFTDIVIYEKSNRVGGKSYDVTLENTVNYMGTVFIEPNYFDTVVPLAKQYGVGDLVQIPSANMFRYNSGFKPGSKLRTQQYMVGSLQNITGEEDPLSNVKQLLIDMGRYIKIHQEMFGSYKGELMPRPSADVLYRIRGTFLDFLKREKLLTLVPYFLITQTVQGYGYLDEVGALYGLMWNNPKFVVTSALRAVGQDKDPLSVYVLRDGFELIWKTIAEKEKLNIKFNSDIVRISRHHKGANIYLYKNFVRRRESCGFLIWAAPMEEYFKTVTDYGSDEFYIFETMAPVIFSSSLVKMTSDIRNGPYTAFLENINKKADHGIIVEASSGGLKTENIRQPDVMDQWDENNSREKTCTVLQLGRKFSNEKDLNSILTSHYKDHFNATDVEILQTISWEYFPR